MADTKFEKLVNSIMAECEADGEPVTRAEAEEMAKMELGAKAERHYEQSDKKRKSSTKVRKVDETKKALLDCIKTALEDFEGTEVQTVKTETEIAFTFGGDRYTVKLTKHRPPKV
jgi:hypothetical protein